MPKNVGSVEIVTEMTFRQRVVAPSLHFVKPSSILDVRNSHHSVRVRLAGRMESLRTGWR